MFRAELSGGRFMPTQHSFFRIFALAWLLFLTGLTSLVAQEQRVEVAPGDTLYSLARRYDTSVQQIMDLNDISDPRELRVGQMILVSQASMTAAPAEIAYPLEEYVVQSGDTLYGIARRTGMQVSELLSVNGLQESAVIKPGQELKVRTLPQSTSQNQQVSVSTTPTRSGTILSSSPSTGGDDVFWPHDGQRFTFEGKFPGIVIRGSVGDEIVSVSSGRVVYSGPHSTLGNVVFIQNPHGYIYIYGGNRQLFVQQGDEVAPGQVIGTLGETPLLSEVQVYFSVWKEGRYLDPTTAPR